MVNAVSILGFGIPKAPRDQTLQSYPVPIIVPIGTTRIIHFPSEFFGIARSLEISNNDGLNVATYRINNDRTNSKTLGVNNFRTISDMWIVQLEVIAGAAGTVDVTVELVPINELR